MTTHSSLPSALLTALQFASNKHRKQRRKDADASPYINHPIAVANLLATTGEVSDIATLTAAVLHDTIEDTETTPEELEAQFGAEVRRLVAEVTDDKSLDKQTQRQRQVEHAPGLSPGAKTIKLADLSCNLADVIEHPPATWSMERRTEYLNWTARVIAGCRGVNNRLEQHYDQLLRRGGSTLTVDDPSERGDDEPLASPKQEQVAAEETGGWDFSDWEAGAAESRSSALEVFPAQDEIDMTTTKVDHMEPTTPTRGSSWLFRVVAAGCLVAAGGLGWYAAQQVNLTQDLRVGLAEATARIERSERDATMARQASDNARARTAILAAPDLSSVTLEAQPGARDARGRAFWSPTHGVVLAASDIPPISSDRVYQLWFVIPPNPVSAGLLRVDDAGRIFETITLPEGSSPPVAIAVTPELRGGAESPTGDALLLGRTDR